MNSLSAPWALWWCSLQLCVEGGPLLIDLRSCRLCAAVAGQWDCDGWDLEMLWSVGQQAHNAGGSQEGCAGRSKSGSFAVGGAGGSSSWSRSQPTHQQCLGNQQRSAGQPCTMTPNGRLSRPTLPTWGTEGESGPAVPKSPFFNAEDWTYVKIPVGAWRQLLTELLIDFTDESM